MSRMIEISYYKAVSFLLCIGETRLFLFSISPSLPSFLCFKYIYVCVYIYTHIYIMRVHYVPGIVLDMWFIGKQNETQSLNKTCIDPCDVIET